MNLHGPLANLAFRDDASGPGESFGHVARWLSIRPSCSAYRATMTVRHSGAARTSPARRAVQRPLAPSERAVEAPSRAPGKLRYAPAMALEGESKTRKKRIDPKLDAAGWVRPKGKIAPSKPDELAAEAITELEAAVIELNRVLAMLEGNGVESKPKTRASA